MLTTTDTESNPRAITVQWAIGELREIGPTAKALLFVLAKHLPWCDKHATKWGAWTDQFRMEFLAERVGVSPRTIPRAMAVLEDRGWIVSSRERGRVGVFRLMVRRLVKEGKKAWAQGGLKRAGSHPAFRTEKAHPPYIDDPVTLGTTTPDGTENDGVPPGPLSTALSGQGAKGLRPALEQSTQAESATGPDASAARRIVGVATEAARVLGVCVPSQAFKSVLWWLRQGVSRNLARHALRRAVSVSASKGERMCQMALAQHIALNPRKRERQRFEGNGAADAKRRAALAVGGHSASVKGDAWAATVAALEAAETAWEAQQAAAQTARRLKREKEERDLMALTQSMPAAMPNPGAFAAMYAVLK